MRGFFAAFRRVELGEARAENAGLPVFTAGSDLLLLDAIFELPDFRSVAGSESQNDNFEERIFGAKVELVVELRDQRAKLFEESDTDGFEIARGLVGKVAVLLIGSIIEDGLEVAVEADGLGIGGTLPLAGSEKNADMGGIELQEAGRDGFGFERLIDGGEDDDIFLGDVDDDAATGEVGDDFVFALGGLSGGGLRKEGEEEE